MGMPIKTIDKKCANTIKKDYHSVYKKSKKLFQIQNYSEITTNSMTTQQIFYQIKPLCDDILKNVKKVLKKEQQDLKIEKKKKIKKENINEMSANDFLTMLDESVENSIEEEVDSDILNID